MSLSNGILSSSPTFSLFVHHRSQPKRKAQSNKNRVNPKAFSHPQIWKESLDFYMYEILSDSGKKCTTVFLVPSIEIFGANSSRSWVRPRKSKWKFENSSWVLKQKRPDPSPFILKENQVPDANWDANRFVEVCTELSSLTPEMMPTDTTSPPFLNRSEFLPVNCHSEALLEIGSHSRRPNLLLLPAVPAICRNQSTRRTGGPPLAVAALADRRTEE